VHRFCVFLFIFLRVAVSASCQEPCCPAHIMFFHCVTLLCYAPDVEQIKMMKIETLNASSLSRGEVMGCPHPQATKGSGGAS